MPLIALIKRNWRLKYIISMLSKMDSTKRVYKTGIIKLEYKKVMKRILGTIVSIIGLRIFAIDIK